MDQPYSVSVGEHKSVCGALFSTMHNI